MVHVVDDYRMNIDCLNLDDESTNTTSGPQTMSLFFTCTCKLSFIGRVAYQSRETTYLVASAVCLYVGLHVVSCLNHLIFDPISISAVDQLLIAHWDKSNFG